MSGVRRRLNELTAISLPIRSSCMYRLIPPTIETTAMRNVTPIITPITVKKLLSFCTRMVSQAIRTACRNDMGRMTLRARVRDGCSRSATLEPVPTGERVARFVGRDQSVAQDNDATSVRRDVRLVRHHDDCLTGAGERLEH